MNKKQILISVAIILVLLAFYIISTKKAQAPVVENTNTPSQSLLNKKYIRSVDEWPPQVEFSKATFTCVEGGNEIETKGTIVKKIISGHNYCVTIAREGAAGSTYTTYTYSTESGDQLASVSFILQTVGCMNYDEPEQTTCKNEQASFDVDLLANSLIFDK